MEWKEGKVHGVEGGESTWSGRRGRYMGWKEGGYMGWKEGGYMGGRVQGGVVGG